MTNPPLSSSRNLVDKNETALRLMILGALYGLAVFFAVVFSPGMGFVAPHPVGETGRVAAAPDASQR